MPAPAATSPKTEAAQRLRQVIGRLHRSLRLTDASAAAGLTPARISALLNIDRHGPMRLSRLAEEEGLNPTMLSRMVGEMVEAGLVERTCDVADRRAAWVGVTDMGAALSARMRQERTQAVIDALEHLDTADADLIDAALPALERLVEGLRERSA